MQPLRALNYKVLQNLLQVRGLAGAPGETLLRSVAPPQVGRDDPAWQLEEVESTEKWHPLTFAVAMGNMELVPYLVENSLGNTKKLLKVPGLFNSQQLNRLFPLVVSLSHATAPQSQYSVSHKQVLMGNSGIDMFRYFWDANGHLWNEDALESLLKLLARRELPDLVPLLFESRTTQTILEAMSYQYRFSFVEHLLQIRHDILEETGEDPERRAALSHFYERVYESLSAQPYSLYFYLGFSKELIRAPPQDQESSLALLRKALKNIKDEEIEVFLHYSPEVAVQIVNDLIDEPSNSAGPGSAQRFESGGGKLSTAIDREMRTLAQKVKKCPHYKSYKEYLRL